MKHLPSFLTYYFKHSMIANITAFLFFFSFHFLFFFLDKWQVKVHVSVKFPAEVDSLYMYIFIRFPGPPQKSLKIARKHIWRPKKEDTVVMCQRPFEKS